MLTRKGVSEDRLDLFFPPMSGCQFDTLQGQNRFRFVCNNKTTMKAKGEVVRQRAAEASQNPTLTCPTGIKPQLK